MIDNDNDRNNQQSYLCLPEISIGLPLGSGFAALAKCKMTPSTLRTSALTGKKYNGKEALKAGLIDEIIPNKSLLPFNGKDNVVVPSQVIEMAKKLTNHLRKRHLTYNQNGTLW